MASDPNIAIASKLDQAKGWATLAKDATVSTVAVMAMFAGKFAFEEFRSMQNQHFAAVEKIRAEDSGLREKQLDRFLAVDEKRQMKLDVVVEKLNDVARTLGDTAREVRRTSALRAAEPRPNGN